MLPAFAILALGLFSSAALAQDAPPAATAANASAPIELTVNQGSVLVSTGGEFAALVPGQALAPGQRVLVGEDAAATLTYGNGCQKSLSTPGVYVISPDCSAVGTPRSGPSTAMIVGATAGIVAVGLAAGGGGSDGPVSR